MCFIVAYASVAWFIFLYPFAPFSVERNGLRSTDGRKARLKTCSNFPFPFYNGCKTNSRSPCFVSEHPRTDGCCHLTVHHSGHIFIHATQPLPPISANVFRSHSHINFAVPAPKGSDAFGFPSRPQLARAGGAGSLLGWTDGQMDGTASPGTEGEMGIAKGRVCSG